MNKNYYLNTKNLTVGYKNKPLISNINFSIKKGEIVTLIGPNGSGKSTILKTITKHLSRVSGDVFILDQSIKKMSNKDMAKKLSVVLTERITPEMMTCRDVVATGRYPYTTYFEKFNTYDDKIVTESIKKVHAEEIADCDFSTISDGQRQRIMLARAICQEPEIIVLDEPTSFLDIKYKMELLQILREMSKEKNITIIMSLHEIELAAKISDKIICVKGTEIYKYGTPDEIFTKSIINTLYGIKNGSYNVIFGSVELEKPIGTPQIFIIAGNGKGTPMYRNLQKLGIPFSTGILFSNDIDFQTAKMLSENVFYQEAFTEISDKIVNESKKILKTCKVVINAGTQICAHNYANKLLFDEAQKNNIPIYTDINKALKVVL